MCIDESQDECTIQLEGVVGLPVIAELRANALAALSSEKAIVVSCANVDRLDSSALQILIALKTELQKRGSALRLSDISDSVAAYINCAGLAVLLPAAE